MGRFPRRLARLSDAALGRMARGPSYLAPHPSELLDPGPFAPPGPPPMPADERALLDAVLADPDADEPRLRYAELLERRGDPRGEFIRLHMRSDPASCDRAAKLLAAHRAEWEAPFAPWSAGDFRYWRGFVEWMSLSGRAFISIGEGLFRIAPVRNVRLVAVAPFLAELADSPHLLRLKLLDLRGNRIGVEGLRELARAPQLDRLRSLSLSRNDLGGDGLRLLAGSATFGRVVELFAAGNQLTTPDVAALADRPFQYLDLSDNPLGPEIVPLIQRSGALADYNGVFLSSTGLGPTGAAALAAAIGDRVGTLDLGFNGIGDAGAERLAAAGASARVVDLKLAGNRIGPKGATALAEARPFASLDLSANHIGDEGAWALFNSRPTSSSVFNLTSTGITANGIERIVTRGQGVGVVRLRLGWNPLGDRGVAALAGSPMASFLRELDLRGTNFGPAGVAALVESHHLSGLRVVYYGHNPRLTPDAVRILRERFGPGVCCDRRPDGWPAE